MKQIFFLSKSLPLKGILILLLTLGSSLPSASQSRQQAKGDFESTLVCPLEIKQIGSDHYFIDFGKTFFGTLIIRSRLSQENKLVVHLGEKLAGPLQIDRDPGGSIRYQKVEVKRLLKDELTTIELPPNKRNANPPAILLPDSFGIVMPFRYCELENLQLPVEDIEIWLKAYHYSFNDHASFFTSSDTILNAIWDLCKHTLKASSFTGYYIDGDRERIPYEADAFINQLSHYCVDSVYSPARRTNAYFMDHPTWPTEWLLHTVFLFYYDYLYTGDRYILEENYELLKLKTLMDLERDDGLISSVLLQGNSVLKSALGFSDPDIQIRDIVDWPPAQKDTGWKLATEEGERDGYEFKAINTVVNAFYYHNLQLMEIIAEKLGKTEDANMFQEKGASVYASINQTLFDPLRGIYMDGEGSEHASLHANMFPLAFDLVPEEHQERVVNFIKSRGMACSVYGAQYLLEGLYKYGEAEYATRLITDTTGDRNWWNMIRAGSTMTLEAWDLKYKPNLDWNHAWGTAPANMITRYIWGITPAEPGFTSAQIRPQLDGLSFSRIKVPTKKGIILASYRRSKNQEIFEIELPAGMGGQFILEPALDGIQLNGKNIPVDKDMVKLAPGINILKIAK
jgi:alpha-L-rhamnosidase